MPRGEYVTADLLPKKWLTSKQKTFLGWAVAVVFFVGYYWVYPSWKEYQNRVYHFVFKPPASLPTLRIVCNGNVVGNTGELISIISLEEMMPDDWEEWGTGTLLTNPKTDDNHAYWQMWIGVPIDFLNGDGDRILLIIDRQTRSNRVATFDLIEPEASKRREN